MALLRLYSSFQQSETFVKSSIPLPPRKLGADGCVRYPLRKSLNTYVSFYTHPVILDNIFSTRETKSKKIQYHFHPRKCLQQTVRLAAEIIFCFPIIIIITIIIIIIIIFSFMQGIYTHIPETNNVPREYSVAAILLLLFMVLISLVSVLNLSYFYISTLRSMCAVPNMAVFWSSLTSCFPGMLLTYFLNDMK